MNRFMKFLLNILKR